MSGNKSLKPIISQGHWRVSFLQIDAWVSLPRVDQWAEKCWDLKLERSPQSLSCNHSSINRSRAVRWCSRVLETAHTQLFHILACYTRECGIFIFCKKYIVHKIRLSIKPDSCNVLWDRGSCNPGCNTLFMATCKKSYCAHNIIYCARNIWLYSLDIVQDRLMFLFRSSAVEGTYSLDPVFFFPLFGINSLTHSPLAAAISLKHNKHYSSKRMYLRQNHHSILGKPSNKKDEKS